MREGLERTVVIGSDGCLKTLKGSHHLSQLMINFSQVVKVPSLSPTVVMSRLSSLAPEDSTIKHPSFANSVCLNKVKHSIRKYGHKRPARDTYNLSQKWTDISIPKTISMNEQGYQTSILNTGKFLLHYYTLRISKLLL